MAKLPGISHQRAVKAFERRGFRVVRQGKHISMTDGERIIVVPRANPINASPWPGSSKDAGMSVEEFKQLL